jgi:hypothetical protein
VAHTCNPSYLGGIDQEDQSLRSARQGENTQHKKVIRVAQVEEHLPSKCETPSSNPSTTKNTPNQNWILWHNIH